ncbi:MAG TPA: serine hydrolase domain-containing protein [Blastocatellia bacterium]|nr:serine hydrolase domain-containing protein [Blastocatellia bacterium]
MRLKTYSTRALVFLLTLLLAAVSLAQSPVRRSTPATAQAGAISLPRVTPEAVGMSAERLARIRTVIQQAVDQGKIAGAVTLILRNGKVAHLDAVGQMDEGKPMRTDALFRICSMSKAVTSVAVMMLYEEGRLLLDDPISKYIPEFKDVQVAVPSSETQTFNLVPATKSLTIRQLLTHTSGITYRFIGASPVAKLYKDAGIVDGLAQTDSTLADNIKKLARLPLMFQPGDRFAYGLSTDVLGYLVEVVSGMTLDEFFRRRIFEPLRMTDTGFYPPEPKLARLAAVYTQLPDGHIRRMGDDEVSDNGYLIYSASYPFKGMKRYYSGGAGLVSTINDYGRFLQALLNGGELEGARILSRKTVELMTVNHVGDLYGAQGFGLGFSIVRDLGKGSELGSVGQYGWGGFFYTNFFVDPKEKLVGVFMSQLYPSNGVRLHERFRALAYQAITD